MTALSIEPYHSDYPDIYRFPFPEAVAKKAGTGGISMSVRYFFELLARIDEDKDPKFAALLREAASHFPEVDGSYVICRDKRGNMIIDYDDWDELTDEAKINRGAREAAIANLERIRFALECAGDGPRDAGWVSDIRRYLAALGDLEEDVRHAEIKEALEELVKELD